jgi:hypothetical protein
MHSTTESSRRKLATRNLTRDLGRRVRRSSEKDRTGRPYGSLIFFRSAYETIRIGGSFSFGLVGERGRGDEKVSRTAVWMALERVTRRERVRIGQHL